MLLEWHLDPKAPSGRGVTTLLGLHETARLAGWEVRYQEAAGPPVSVAMKVAKGPRRAYGLWSLTTSLRWLSGAHNIVDPPTPPMVAKHMHPLLRTLKDFKAFLEGGPDDD